MSPPPPGLATAMVETDATSLAPKLNTEPVVDRAILVVTKVCARWGTYAIVLTASIYTGERASANYSAANGLGNLPRSGIGGEF